MTVLITMAGLGSRFSRAGYKDPKYKVMTCGRSLFEWSMLSLANFFNDRFVFVTLIGDDKDWLLEQAKNIGICDAAVITRSSLSLGQAETAYDALSIISPNDPLWIYNIDTYVANGLHPEDMVGSDGCVHVFHSINPGMSFVRYNQTGEVEEVAEKSVISEWATVGMYGFSSAAMFGELYLETYAKSTSSLVGGERYIAPIYQTMLSKGLRLVAPKLVEADVHVLGTPEQVVVFEMARPSLIG